MAMAADTTCLPTPLTVSLHLLPCLQCCLWSLPKELRPRCTGSEPLQRPMQRQLQLLLLLCKSAYEVLACL